MSHDDPMSEINGERMPINPELISAFFDGETTPEERAAVEESMGDGGATLQTLDDYDQLSQSLKQLHRAAGSPDLQESVLAQIRPPARVAGAAPLLAKPRRRMLSIVAGLTGLAAVVTLMAWPWPDAQRENQLAVNDAEYEYTAAGTAEAMSAGGELPPAAADSAAPALASARIGSPAAPAPMSSTEMAEMEAGVDSSLAELASERPLPEVGDVLGYMDQNADELTWVAVTVVDVQTAGDQVQLLLTRHGVESPDPADEAPAPPPNPEDRMTFLVEADWDQMEAVIVDLSDSQFVNELAVKAPQEEGVPKELQDYRVQRGGDPAADEKALESNRLAQKLRSRVEQRQKPDADRGAAIARVPDSEKREAVQLQLLMPDVHLKRIAARRGVEAALSEMRSPAGQPADAAPAEAAADQPEPPAREAETDRIGLPLASRRAKVVIVIQKQNR